MYCSPHDSLAVEKLKAVHVHWLSAALPSGCQKYQFVILPLIIQLFIKKKKVEMNLNIDSLLRNHCHTVRELSVSGSG